MCNFYRFCGTVWISNIANSSLLITIITYPSSCNQRQVSTNSPQCSIAQTKEVEEKLICHRLCQCTSRSILPIIPMILRSDFCHRYANAYSNQFVPKNHLSLDMPCIILFKLWFHINNGIFMNLWHDPLNVSYDHINRNQSCS